jgi:hypothetical protein
MTRHTTTQRPTNDTRRRRRPTTGAAVVGLTALATIGLSTGASADQAYHTYHAPLTAVGADPLHKGFVNNIHANGPTVYAMEYYHLVGAAPSTTYTAVIYLYPFAPDCSGTPLDFGFLGGIPSAEIRTNRAGNGHGASPKFTPEDVAGLRGAEHGVNWVIVDEDLQPAFESGCSADFLD